MEQRRPESTRRPQSETRRTEIKGRPLSDHRRTETSERPHSEQRRSEYSGKPRREFKPRGEFKSQGEFKPHERRDENRRRGTIQIEKPRFEKKPSMSPSIPPAPEGDWRTLMATMEEGRGGLKKKLKRLFIRDKS